MRSNACFWILTELNEEPSLLVLAALNNGFGACRRIQRLSRRLVYILNYTVTNLYSQQSGGNCSSPLNIEISGYVYHIWNTH